MANCLRNGGGKEQNERKVVKGDSDDNVNPKMRFKAIFPTTCSQVRESNFMDFFVAASDCVAGTDSHSEIGDFPIALPTSRARDVIIFKRVVRGFGAKIFFSRLCGEAKCDRRAR